jgi:hypothetical protein
MCICLCHFRRAFLEYILCSLFSKHIRRYLISLALDNLHLYFIRQAIPINIETLAKRLILLACLLFLTNTHIRRKYYIGNHVATGLNAAAACAMAVWTHLQVSAFRTTYLATVDFEMLQKRLKSRGTFTDSTFWFDIHYLVCAAALIAAILLIVNIIWKKRLMRGEQELLQSSGKAVSA